MFTSKSNAFLCQKAFFSNLFSKLLLEHLIRKSHVNRISIGQNYNKQRILLVNEVYSKLNSTCF